MCEAKKKLQKIAIPQILSSFTLIFFENFSNTSATQNRRSFTSSLLFKCTQKNEKLNKKNFTRNCLVPYGTRGALIN